MLDIRLIALTLTAIVSRSHALVGVQRLLSGLGANDELLALAARRQPLTPRPPPGGSKVVTSRDGNPFT